MAQTDLTMTETVWQYGGDSRAFGGTLWLVALKTSAAIAHVDHDWSIALLVHQAHDRRQP